MALSDSAGHTVQTYEYSIYGQVAAEDPNHPNPYMFTGRRFDVETGLYYYRARYYNPYIGRFLQTDPVGYGAGMNLYAYCGNNPANMVDPLGLYFLDVQIPIDSIIDPERIADGSADGEAVDGWLSEVGFYDEYPDWSLYFADVNGAFFDCTFYVDDDDYEKDPVFRIEKVGGVQVVVIDGIGRLNDWTLNRIIAHSVHRVNQWWLYGNWVVNLAMHANDLRGIRTDTPFQDSKVVQWIYKGIKSNRSEVNYILEGHAMRRLGIPRDVALKILVSGWKNVMYGHPASGAVFLWFEKGYDEYESRAAW